MAQTRTDDMLTGALPDTLLTWTSWAGALYALLSLYSFADPVRASERQLELAVAENEAERVALHAQRVRADESVGVTPVRLASVPRRDASGEEGRLSGVLGHLRAHGAGARLLLEEAVAGLEEAAESGRAPFGVAATLSKLRPFPGWRRRDAAEKRKRELAVADALDDF